MRACKVQVGAGILLSAVTLLVADAWFFSKYFFTVKRFRIGTPNSAEHRRILLLTDLHFKKRFWPFHHRLVNKINRLRPHLLLFAGDLIDVHGTPGPARQFLNSLDGSIPKLFIQGNHDHKNSVSRHTLRSMVETHNGRLLINETVQLTLDGLPFTITGLDDFIEGESCFADAVKEVGKEERHLLLIHSPLQQEMVSKEAERLNRERPADMQIDLQYIFAGHTHGGQVRFRNYLPVPPHHSGHYLEGWYNSSKPYLYVSKGFGTARAPFRFGARPEITLFAYGV